MAESASCCSYCGKQGKDFKRCSACKQASYCGAECQNEAWRKHKKTCAPPLSLGEVLKKVGDGSDTSDWREVLKHEGRLEELMARTNDSTRCMILHAFTRAHMQGTTSTGSTHHIASIVRLEERHVALLASMERFRDSGEAVCNMAQCLLQARLVKEATTAFQRARDLGAAHGFFSVECQACLGLGKIFMAEGKVEEGVEMLRHSFTTASFNENDDATYEMPVLRFFVDALLDTKALEEVTPLVPRYRELTKVDAGGELGFEALHSVLVTARLHEALGRPQEAAREVRALLVVTLRDQASIQLFRAQCCEVLGHAVRQLRILDSESGDQDLLTEVALVWKSLSV